MTPLLRLNEWTTAYGNDLSIVEPFLGPQDLIAAGPDARQLTPLLERGARVKRRPHWLQNTVDPALAAANRIVLPDLCASYR